MLLGMALLVEPSPRRLIIRRSPRTQQPLDIPMQQKSELRALHGHFAQRRHPRPLTCEVRSAHTAAAVGAAITTRAHSFPSRLLLAARRALSAGWPERHISNALFCVIGFCVFGCAQHRHLTLTWLDDCVRRKRVGIFKYTSYTYEAMSKIVGGLSIGFILMAHPNPATDPDRGAVLLVARCSCITPARARAPPAAPHRRLPRRRPWPPPPWPPRRLVGRAPRSLGRPRPSSSCAPPRPESCTRTFRADAHRRGTAKRQNGGACRVHTQTDGAHVPSRRL